MLVPVDIPPGVYRAGTEYRARGRWYDASLVRFFAGTIQPVGGWEQMQTGAITGRPCAVTTWRPNQSSIGRWLTVGTNQAVYAFDGLNLQNITPPGFTAGLADATADGGYGAGAYGSALYGTARAASSGVTPVDAWSFDLWGDHLVGVYTADGRVCEWDLGPASTLTPIVGAPSAKAVVVSHERMLFALAADGDYRRIAWSDQEDNTTWAASVSTTAGDLLLSTSGRIVTGERVRSGLLIHTTSDVHLVSYVGPPFFYGVERVGENCGVISPHAVVSAGAITVWMGENGFFTFDGYVRPLPCEVHDHVFGRINRLQASKCFAWHNGLFGEIWFHYPAGTSNEVSDYVVWNYRENHWTIGVLPRTCGVGEGAWEYPILADRAGAVYEHEKGTETDGAGRWLESGPMEAGLGDKVVWLRQLLHDESGSVDALSMTIKTRYTPEGTEYTAGPYVLDDARGYTDIRAQGRSYRLRFDEVQEVPWRLGAMRLDVTLGGKR